MEHAMKYCDLVMKGGITSGIVYPNAVLALAREFRFKSVGGTSAGAIAAAVTAAAACGDRRKTAGTTATIAGRGLRRPGRSRRATDDAGLHRAPVPTRVGRAQRVPRARVRDGHGVAMEEDRRDRRRDHGDGAARIPARLRLAARAGVFARERRRLAGDAVAVFFCAYAAAAISAVLRVARVVRGNLFGLCNGLSASTRPALIEWLHAVLQRLSGQTTHRDRSPSPTCAAPRFAGEPATPDAIVLRMITTSVSHREPRTLPFPRRALLVPARRVRPPVPEGRRRLDDRQWRQREAVEGKTYYPLPPTTSCPCSSPPA
jgi:hypothetical protein